METVHKILDLQKLQIMFGRFKCILSSEVYWDGVNNERDIGVQLDRSLQEAAQENMLMNKAFVMFAFISHGTEYINRNIIIQQDILLVRPYLVYLPVTPPLPEWAHVQTGGTASQRYEH